MAKPPQRRADRPKKRKHHGNSQTAPLKKKKLNGFTSTSAPASVPVRVRKVVNKPASPPTQAPSPHSVDKLSSASTVKLGKRKPEVQFESFDSDESLTGFRFVDITLLIDFVQSLLCPTCKTPLGDNQRLSDVTENRTNQASKLVFTCGCQNKVDFSTSKKCGKVFEVNRRFPLEILSVGRNYTAAKRFLGNMNMPPPPYKKSWQNHKKQITKATKRVAVESKSQAAQDVKASTGDTIKVSCDGTYHRRGFTSKNGVVTVLSVNGKDSKVIDTVVMSNYCDACQKHKKKKTPADFQLWFEEHTAKGECQRNHTGSAASMEPAGTETSFRRSEEMHGLRYSHFLGDGDSKSYSRVKNADPPIYNGIEIQKLECCGHVQKRMGRQLTNKVSKHAVSS